MADQVKITLGADTSSAVSSLREFQTSVQSATDTVQAFAGPSGIGAVVTSAQQSIDAINGIRGAVALGFSTGPMIAFTAVLATVAFTIKEAIGLVDDLSNKAKAIESFRSSVANSLLSYNKQLRKALDEGLISEDEFFKKGSIANEDAFPNAKTTEQKAAAIAKLVGELKELLEVRRKILADREATKKADEIEFASRLKTQTSASGFAEASDRRYMGAGVLSAESFESRQKESAKQVFDAQMQVFEEKDKQLKADLEKADSAHAIVIRAQKIALDADRFEAEKNYQAKVIAIEEESAAKIRSLKEEELQKQLNIRDTLRRIEAERLAQIEARNEAMREGFEIERAKIAGDFRLSEIEKRSATIKSLTDQNALDGVGNKRSKQQLGFLQADADPNSIKDQTIKSLVDIKNAMGTTAQSIANVFTSPLQGAFVGLQTGIEGLIKGTMRWKDAAIQLGQSILNSIVQAMSQMIAKAIILSTIGLIPGLGGFAGALIPGRASGGIAGPGLYQVGEQGPEYVVNNSTLNRMGGGFFDSLQAGYTPPQAASAGSSSNVHIGFIGGQAMVQQWAESRDGRKFIADISNQQIRESRG